LANISSKRIRRSFIEMISKEFLPKLSLILKVYDRSVDTRLEFTDDEED